MTLAWGSRYSTHLMNELGSVSFSGHCPGLTLQLGQWGFVPSGLEQGFSHLFLCQQPAQAESVDARAHPGTPPAQPWPVQDLGLTLGSLTLPWAPLLWSSELGLNLAARTRGSENHVHVRVSCGGHL